MFSFICDHPRRGNAGKNKWKQTLIHGKATIDSETWFPGASYLGYADVIRGLVAPADWY